jgi:hypothetical protein
LHFSEELFASLVLMFMMRLKAVVREEEEEEMEGEEDQLKFSLRNGYERVIIFLRRTIWEPVLKSMMPLKEGKGGVVTEEEDVDYGGEVKFSLSF